MKKKLLFIALLTSILGFAQASLVKDINPGGGGGISFLGFEGAVINNKLVFVGYDQSANSYGNIWITDGTTSGTNILHQVVSPGVDSQAKGFYYSSVLNKLIFTSNYGGANTNSVLVTDGVSTGLENLSGSNYASSPIQYPSEFTDFNGMVFYNLMQENLNNGNELHTTDGTLSGTGLFKELRPGMFGGIPSNFTVFNNNLYFVSTDPSTSGSEIWVSDGTSSGTNLFIDLNPGVGHSYPSELTVFNNKIYFTADNGTNGRELWTTDGSVSGTYMVLDLYSGSIGSNPTNLTVYNNALYFTATHATLGGELFKMTASETITNLKNINSGNASSSPFNLYVYNNELYFAADDGNGVELWKSGGFNSNTNKLIDINPTGESNPGNFNIYNGKLYFVADDGSTGRELWVTDGTAAGTSLVIDIRAGSMGSNPSDFFVINNMLIFNANDNFNGKELWRYQDPTLSVNDFKLAGNEVKLFPNPTKGYFELTTTINIEKLELYNLQGQLVRSFRNQNRYSTYEFQNGVYLVKIFTDKGVVNQMLVKKD